MFDFIVEVGVVGGVDYVDCDFFVVGVFVFVGDCCVFGEDCDVFFMFEVI